MSWFSDHVYDAGYLTSDTKEFVSDVINKTTGPDLLRIYSGENMLDWDDDGLSIYGSKAGMNFWGGSLGQGTYAFGNLMTRDLPNFLKYPADSLSPNEEGDGTFNKWRQDWRKQWGDWKEKAMEMSPGGGIPDMKMQYEEEVTPPSVKGPGKMRGRDPEMAFNEGVKGYGRSSLKIGKGGSGGGSIIGGKFNAFKSGRYSMPD
jgi:hypothetical protein